MRDAQFITLTEGKLIAGSAVKLIDKKRILLSDQFQFVRLFLEHDVQGIPETCDELILACRTASEKNIYERTENLFKIHIQDCFCEIEDVWENKMLQRIDAATMIQIVTFWKNMISMDTPINP